jgi:hypothetical protein
MQIYPPGKLIFVNTMYLKINEVIFFIYVSPSLKIGWCVLTQRADYKNSFKFGIRLYSVEEGHRHS